MPRIPRVGALASLPSAVVPVNRVPFVARATFSTSTPVNALDSKTQWIRKQLWKGEAPGAEDPYTQRPEPEPTSLPNEALEASQGDRRPGAVRNTRLVLPPTHSEALTEKEIESVATDYIPATTIEDLEEIEPLKTWWEQPGHWGEESEFQGFGRAVKVQDQAVLEVYLRQALVESLSYQQRGLLEEYAAKKWPMGKRSHLDRTLAVSIRFENNGQPMLNTHFRVITEELKARPDEERVEISPEEAKEMLNALDPSWKKASLGNDHLKFAIRKRLYQLTGHFIPDVKLAAANTPKELITVALTINKRGKKLAEVLEEQKGFSKLQNVTVHSRRVTPIDREVSVGRWKVIEEELRKRDLPVTGTGGYGKNKERDWLTGKA